MSLARMLLGIVASAGMAASGPRARTEPPAPADQKSTAVVWFGFHLDKAAPLTSAGIYDPAGHLVRQLWAMKPLEAGTHTGAWDGLDEFSQPAPAGKYEFRVVANRSAYKNVGILGNTGRPPNQLGHIQAGVWSVTVDASGRVYTANQWEEGFHRLKVFDPAGNPLFGTHTRVLPTAIAIDDRYIYCGGAGQSEVLVGRFRADDGKIVPYEAGPTGYNELRPGIAGWNKTCTGAPSPADAAKNLYLNVDGTALGPGGGYPGIGHAWGAKYTRVGTDAQPSLILAAFSDWRAEFVTRDLGENTTDAWILTGKVKFGLAGGRPDDTKGMLALGADTARLPVPVPKQWTDFSILAKQGKAACTFGGRTVTVTTAAPWNIPKTLRFTLASSAAGDHAGKCITVLNKANQPIITLKASSDSVAGYYVQIADLRFGVPPTGQLQAGATPLAADRDLFAGLTLTTEPPPLSGSNEEITVYDFGSNELVVGKRIPATAPPEDAALMSDPIRAIAVSADTLYVADALGGRVLLLDKSTGRPRGQFSLKLPVALALDRQGRLWAGHEHHKVSVFASDGRPLGLQLSAIGDVRSLCFGADGLLYVADGAAGVVHVYDVAGKEPRLSRAFGHKAKPGESAPHGYYDLRGRRRRSGEPAHDPDPADRRGADRPL